LPKGIHNNMGLISMRHLLFVVCMDTIRILVGIAAQLKLQVFQLDVRSAFLNGELEEEEVYVE